MASPSDNVVEKKKEEIGEEPIQFEVLEEDAFQLVCDVTDLATLESELHEVRRQVARQRNSGRYQPFRLFYGSSNSISVSDICGGLWCEQQVEYRHLYPYLQRTNEWKRVQAERKKHIPRRTATMETGTQIHYRKEIEIHDIPIRVPAPTREDKWAVDLVNTFVKLKQISRGGIGAEIKIYGIIEEVVLSGIVDQLQYCPEDRSFVLLELKTRKSNTLPQEEQKRGHCLQLMLYKLLVDSFIGGMTNYCVVAQKLGLKLSQFLSPGPVEYVYNSGVMGRELLNVEDTGFSIPPPHPPGSPLLTSHLQSSGMRRSPRMETIVNPSLTLEQLINAITVHVTDLELPQVDTLLLQYIYQVNDQVLGVETVLHDEAWATKELRSSLGYWLGEREASGVDVEESWKCTSCQFSEACVSRKRQLVVSSPVKKWPPLFVQDAC